MARQVHFAHRSVAQPPLELVVPDLPPDHARILASAPSFTDGSGAFARAKRPRGRAMHRAAHAPVPPDRQHPQGEAAVRRMSRARFVNLRRARVAPRLHRFGADLPGSQVMKRVVELFFVVVGLLAAACAHAPTKPGERADLTNDARATLARMESKDPGLRSTLDRSVAFIVFPKVGSGGFIVGGGGGAGVLYERGAPSGFVTLEHFGVGAIAGGTQYAQIVIIRDPTALDDIKKGRFDFGANASAVIIRTGASANAVFNKGVAVVREPLGGAMVNASLSGQRIRTAM
jgi:lipid-binding SYLF domain-containing protein